VPLAEPNSDFLEGLWQQARARVGDMAGQFTPDPETTKTLDSGDVETLWNLRAMPLEKEWELHRATKPDGSPMFTPEQIGLMVFPHRERLMKSGGRVEPKEQVRWANQMAKRQQAKRMAQPPPTDPMTTTASMAPADAGAVSLPASEADYG
jgi:hypothetical protein